MDVQQIAELTAQLQGLEPLRTAKNGPEMWAVLQPLSVALRRLMAGPWPPSAFVAMNAQPAPEPDPALAEAEAALVEARAKFDEAEELWQKTTVALLTMEAKARGPRDNFGNVIQVPARIGAELRAAKADQAAARKHREEALESRQTALVSRNKLAFSLQHQRAGAEYRAALAKELAEKQAKQTSERRKHESRLSRLQSAVIS